MFPKIYTANLSFNLKNFLKTLETMLKISILVLLV